MSHAPFCPAHTLPSLILVPLSCTRSTSQGEISSSESVAVMRGPVGRGLVAVGMSSGSVNFCDPRAKLKVGEGKARDGGEV
jgi:hypothetical protein